MKELRLTVLVLFILIWNIAVSQDINRPNILLFHADDMTWRDCEPYGNAEVVTPNISRLAEEGVCFDNMHTSTAMCSPCRQQLYTGLYPVRSGAFPNHSMVYWGVKSLCHYFDELDYRVALIGKTHHDPVESFPFEFLGGRHHDNGEGVDIELERIKPLINQHKNPFFLVVSTNQPHSPWNRGPDHLYDSDRLTVPEYMVDCDETRKNLARYYAEITYADSLLGECMKYLEEAGQTNNTIVIFTSEQGSSFPMAKWTCYDLGLKTAFVVKWPGKVSPGTRNSALTQYVDVVPTLLEAAGGDPLVTDCGIEDNFGNRGFDGQSFLDLMFGKTDDHRDYVYGVHTTRGIFSGSVSYPVRSVRSSRYKYIINLNSSSPFLNYLIAAEKGLYHTWLDKSADDPKMYAFVRKYMYRPAEELYDIIKDPWEMNNLADDPAMADVRDHLIGKLVGWMEQQGDRGIDTEMEALDRILRFDEESWQGYDEEKSNRILKQKR